MSEDRRLTVQPRATNCSLLRPNMPAKPHGIFLTGIELVVRNTMGIRSAWLQNGLGIVSQRVGQSRPHKLNQYRRFEHDGVRAPR
jgi:hypothetical protein